ncbi:prolipoprotein diacylglyceryl transferase [Paenibacillus woosongensis]|uniref:Prolipoprotein diacylglyceryl transferase n=1 Tax=Paenibacillus woosongensis TaxID=307580 RepID=A0AA95I1U6_9BACL|nr:prolipoprotein diacylglyceryl transferase family protein [Paenibacillus woosongensis]WHX47056.1 prolipoprotein diacylglyceryl transferase [Paenibacillus woosongensis]
MEFPVYIHIGGLRIHPHFLFESLAYFIGFRIYVWRRKKSDISTVNMFWLIVGAALGASLGSKLLFWLENPAWLLSISEHWRELFGGKTIVGGLLGGLIGVELTKKLVGITRSTGDEFAFPLIIAMAIGRIGCFLTGLDDHTHGTPTTWITGFDYGDGVLRHPTQLYEIGFLLILAFALFGAKKTSAARRQELPNGLIYIWFMFGYLTFRFAIDFIKPTPHPYFGLNNIQLACVLGMMYFAYRMFAVSRNANILKGSHAS